MLRLEYEAYEAMAVKTMHELAQEMRRRWPLIGVAIAHRTG